MLREVVQHPGPIKLIVAIPRTALLYPGDGLGPGQNETTQARMKIPRPAQMATVGSQVVGGPRGVQG